MTTHLATLLPASGDWRCTCPWHSSPGWSATSTYPRESGEIDMFERTGKCHPVLFAKLMAALGMDERTRTRLAYEDYKDWLATPANPPTPYMLRQSDPGLPRRARGTEDRRGDGAVRRRLCEEVRHGGDASSSTTGYGCGSTRTGRFWRIFETLPPENPT